MRKSVYAMSGLKPGQKRYIKLRYCIIRGKRSTISENEQFITQSLSLLQTVRQARCLLLKSADICLSCSNAVEINVCTLHEETPLTNITQTKQCRRIRESPTTCTNNCKQLEYSPMPIIFCHKISRVLKDSDSKSNFRSRPTKFLTKEIHSLKIRPLHENYNLCLSMES